MYEQLEGHEQTEPYLLPGHQQVLVHVGAQKAGVAVTFHQFVDVGLG